MMFGVVEVPKILWSVLFIGVALGGIYIPADSWGAVLSMSTGEVDYCACGDVADYVKA